MNLTQPQHHSYYNRQMQHVHQGTQTTVTTPNVPSPQSMPMRPALTLNSIEFENRISLTTLQFLYQ